MSDRRVDEAAPASDVRNPASLLNHESFTDVEAIVCTNPLLPRYANPCPRDDRYSELLNVDEAVENSPPVNPITVDVELYPATDVKLNVEKLASFVSCDVLIVDVANEYVEPLAPTPRKPVDSEGSVSVPIEARVDDEYPNDPSVVDELENVCRAVNVLDVYVLGIVVDELMYELIALFCTVESIVNTPPVFVRPVPSRDVNVDPPSIRLVVDAVVNDAYVVDE